MSEREIVRRGDAAREWVTRWPDAPTVDAAVVVQGHEQVVFVAGGAPIGVVGPGRYGLDPARWPAAAPWLDPDGRTLHIHVFFVTTGGPWSLDVDAPVGAVSGLGAGRSGHLQATAAVAMRVADAVAVVRAVLREGGDFAARHAHWRRDAGRLVADTAHGMLLQGTLDPARTAAAMFAVGRHVLPALRGRLSADGLDAIELERFALVESSTMPAPGPTLLRIEASVLARALAAAPSPEPARDEPAALRTVLVAAPARLGVLRAGVVTPSHDRVGVRHDEGVPVVVMDARGFPRWRGGEVGDAWALRGAVAPGLGLGDWPVARGAIVGEARAREAYDRCRRHLMAAVSGLAARDARADDDEWLAPGSATSEAFLQGDAEVAWLRLDRTTDALSLGGPTGSTAEVALPEGRRGAAWWPGDAAVQCAVVSTAMGEPDGVALVAGLPSGQTFAGELSGRWELPTAEHAVDAPSGWLVVAWARASGRVVADRVEAHGDDGWMAASVEPGRAAAPLPTRLETQAGGAVAWLLRVRPGTWRVTHHHGAVGDGRARCLVLTHAASQAWQPAATLHPPAPRDGAPDEGPPDREVFPGQPVARVSEYVRMVRGLRADQARRKEALAALGIELGDFGEVMQRWSRAMMEDHALGREVARAMNAE